VPSERTESINERRDQSRDNSEGLCRGVVPVGNGDDR
jgi:hypothetical protein